MAHLTYGLHHAEGFIVITGEVGAGKTMLVDRLLSQIDPTSFVTAKIVTTNLGGEDLLRMVASGFGLEHAGQSKGSLLSGIQEFVLAEFAARRRALLIIDEAQNLPFEALEELRMLSNITVGSSTALQSFLLGQPQFRRVLGDRALDQLRQRITAAYHLGPLSEADTRAYIEHRLRCVGWKGDPHFDENSFPLIYRYTGGVPRQINSLCSRLLLFGFLEESHAISAVETEQVAADLQAELSAVAEPSKEQGAALPEEASPSTGAMKEQLVSLERTLSHHDRVIRRMAGIMASYFRTREDDEQR
jgi:type II secretory pathway predicted ATPase ExeA